MILDLFAGPGGWDCGARTLGLDPIGIEYDRDACATRAVAGLRTIRADVSTWPLEQMAGKVEGLIASPPCQDFSLAGKKAGIDGDRGQLMFTVPAYVRALRPRWIACEQVTPALEWWERFAAEFAELGYRCWVGVLNAADFGVPQTRKRAFLLASLDKTPAPPTPTHAKEPVDDLFGRRERWVSMAEALGWGALETWVFERPATTVVGSFCPDIIAAPGYRTDVSRQDAPGSVRITQRDGLILQSFPPDWPVQGSKTSQWRQIGNAVPPRLAAAVLGSVA